MIAGELLESPEDIYAIIEARGEGGFAALWVAERASDGQRVVVKELSLEKLKDWKALELFEREARALKALDHPNIPRYVEFFARTENGALDPRELSENPGARLYLVQELVPGRDIAEMIQAGASVTTQEVHDILKQALSVLEYLHGLNPALIHRDIHPRNLIVSDDGTVHLIDFGAIQHRLHFADEFGSTSVGTFGYIPLEQSMGQAKPASDLYALGMTILTLLTGRNPSEMPIVEHTGVVNLGALAVPASLRPVILGMVQPIAGQRFQSAADALSVLANPNQAIVRGQNTRAVQPKVPTPLWARGLFHTFFWLSLVAAIYIYVFSFDDFSETELVQVSGMWLLPMTFGLAGFFFSGSKNPVSKSVLFTFLAAAMLVFFFAAIFPAL